MSHRPALSSLLAFVLIASALTHPVSGEPAPRSESLLVLTTGRVLRGSVSESSGGYVVDNPDGTSGSMRIPFSLVRFEATNLRDAYLKLQRFMPEVNASNRIALAKWCMNNGLSDEARSELEDAIRREPQRREARELLRRLDRTSASSTALLLTLPKSTSTRSLEFAGPEMKSLAGLSRKTAEQFVAKVQPLLVNKCSNAGCHSSTSRQEFRMRRIRSTGGHRVFSQQNLAAVFKQINMERPDESRLLVALQDDHARRGRQLFDSRAGRVQIKVIQDWVHSAVAERAGEDSSALRTAAKPLPEEATSRRTPTGHAAIATAQAPIASERTEVSPISNTAFPGQIPATQIPGTQSPSGSFSKPATSIQAASQPTQQSLEAALSSFGHSSGNVPRLPLEAGAPVATSHFRSRSSRRESVSTKSWLPAAPVKLPNAGGGDPFDPEEFNRRYGRSRPSSNASGRRVQRQATNAARPVPLPSRLR